MLVGPLSSSQTQTNSSVSELGLVDNSPIGAIMAAASYDTSVAADGWFPLLSAAHADDGAAVRALLDEGADADQAVVCGTGPYPAVEGHVLWAWVGTTPLMLAAKGGRLNAARALAGRATVDLRHTTTGETAAFIAAQEGALDVLRLLHAHGADLNSAENDGATLAHVAAHQGHLRVLHFLEEHQVDLHVPNRIGVTGVFASAFQGRIGALVFLLDRGAAVNQTNEDGETAVHLAARGGQIESLQVLIEHGAVLNHVNNKADTAVHVAAGRGHVGVLKWLSEQGADLNPARNDGVSPLHIAARSGRVDALRFLAGKVADINQQAGPLGYSAVYNAAHCGQLDALRALADLGADLDMATADEEPQTPAMCCVIVGDTETLRVLADLGADIHAAGFDGDTLMGEAAAFGHLAIVLLLLRLGCDASVEDSDANTPLDLAIEERKFDVAFLLENVATAGGWRKYVAARRMAYVRIRHQVSDTYKTAKGPKKLVALLHFLFGKNRVGPSAGQGAEAKAKAAKTEVEGQTAPTDVFRKICTYLDP